MLGKGSLHRTEVCIARRSCLGLGQYPSKPTFMYKDIQTCHEVISDCTHVPSKLGVIAQRTTLPHNSQENHCCITSFVCGLQALASSILCYSVPGMVASYREIQSEGFGQISQLYSLILTFIAVGGLSYGCKLPERWAPGYFDIIGRRLLSTQLQRTECDS